MNGSFHDDFMFRLLGVISYHNESKASPMEPTRKRPEITAVQNPARLDTGRETTRSEKAPKNQSKMTVRSPC